MSRADHGECLVVVHGPGTYVVRMSECAGEDLSEHLALGGQLSPVVAGALEVRGEIAAPGRQ